jgi:hypothetical protein
LFAVRPDLCFSIPELMSRALATLIPPLDFEE